MTLSHAEEFLRGQVLYWHFHRRFDLADYYHGCLKAVQRRMAR